MRQTTAGRWWRICALVGLFATAALMGAGAAAAEDSPAPDYSARLLGSDESASLTDLRGEVVLLNTWATWCVPCREEMPAFEQLYQRHRVDGLQVVAVNIDQGRADDKVTSYVEAAGLSFPIWRDPSNRMAKDFRVLGPPETFLIDRSGRIAFHWRGQMDPEEPANRSRILAALGLEDAGAGAAASAVATRRAVGGLRGGAGERPVPLRAPAHPELRLGHRRSQPAPGPDGGPGAGRRGRAGAGASA